SWRFDFLRSDLILKRHRQAISLPFRGGVREESPKLQRGIGLMRAVKQGLLKRHMVGREIRKLSAYARHRVWMREMVIIVDDESGHRDFFAEGVACVHSKHQVGSVIASPGTRVSEIVLCVERVVSNEAVEQARLQRQPFTYWRQ